MEDLQKFRHFLLNPRQARRNSEPSISTIHSYLTLDASGSLLTNYIIFILFSLSRYALPLSFPLSSKITHSAMLPSLTGAIFNLNEHFWIDSFRAAELPAQPLRRTSSSLVPLSHQHQRPLRRQDRPWSLTGQRERTLDICSQKFTRSAASDGGLLPEYSSFYVDELEKTLNGPLSASLKAIESKGGSDGQLILGILDAVKEVYSLHDRYICLF